MNKYWLSERYHSEPNLHHNRIIEGRLYESYRSEPNLHHCSSDSHKINKSVAIVHHHLVNEETRFERSRSESYLLNFLLNMAGLKEIYRSEPNLNHYLRKTDDGVVDGNVFVLNTKGHCIKPQVLRSNNGYIAVQRPQHVISGSNYNSNKSEMILRSRNTHSSSCMTQENYQIPEQPYANTYYGLSTGSSPNCTRKLSYNNTQEPFTSNNSSLQLPGCVIDSDNYKFPESNIIIGSINKPSVENLSKKKSQSNSGNDIQYHYLLNEIFLEPTMKAKCITTQATNTNNDNPSLKLPGCVILDYNNNLTSPDIILGPRDPLPLQYISQEKNTISKLRHDNINHNSSSESPFDHTPKDGDAKVQLARSNNCNFVDDYAQHLPGYVILDEKEYLNEVNMIFAPGKTPSMENFNQQNIPIPELRNDKTGKKRLFQFRKSFLRYLGACVNPRTEI